MTATAANPTPRAHPPSNTHQQDVGACRFYEQQGFEGVRYGTSPPPESAPDVEYHWVPAR